MSSSTKLAPITFNMDRDTSHLAVFWTAAFLGYCLFVVFNDIHDILMRLLWFDL